MDIGLSQSLQRSNIIVDKAISVGTANLDGVMNVHAFNACKLQASILDFFFQREDICRLPGFTRFCGVQCGYDARDTGDLANLF